MTRQTPPRGTWSVVLALLLSACATPTIDTSIEAANRVRAQELGSYPYHPIAYHLDLSILAYQLYGQTLVWPFDPYYEDMESRDALMGRVREWVEVTGAEQVAREAGIEAYRGPGVLGGFEDNDAHDPILYQYSRLHPWSDTITNASGDQWTEYLTPARITDEIAEVWICTRTIGVSQEDLESGVEGAVRLDALPARREDMSPNARDILMAFEGGTGDKGEPDQPASQSVMGFALLRETGLDGEYDVHIAFRGSRSGSAVRAFVEAWSTQEAGGNPDWITDLGYRAEHASQVSVDEDHFVSRGMAASMGSSMPTLFHCLDHVVGRERAAAPARITITGHSLGGGLAQHFASALLLGDRYGPDGPLMPESLLDWPWERVALITFGAPRVGDDAWAYDLTTDALESVFYDSSVVEPYDPEAVGITDLEILPRLLDTSRPAAYRVLIPSDPITTDLIVDGLHVGQTVYLEVPEVGSIIGHGDTEAHEPMEIRRLIAETLRDERIPETAWRYLDMTELNPGRDVENLGSVEEYERLVRAVSDYYDERGLWFDVAAYDETAGLFLDLVAP